MPIRQDLRADPNDLLPLKPVDLLILFALSEQERHGYGVMLDILERTNGAVRLEAGNLYRSIRHLLADGTVAESARRPARDDDERRRYYMLTPLGRRVLAAELSRLRVLIRVAEQRGLVRPEPA